MNTPATRLILSSLAIGFGTAALPASAAPQPGTVFLAPHLAVYDLKLQKSHGGRGIDGVRGRILYDFTGNACDGYDLKFRQVSELDSLEGKSTLSDLRSNTWEDGAAKKFRFNSENLLNDQQTDAVDGHAEREAEEQELHRAGQRCVPDRAHAAHHRGRARGQEHPRVSGL